ncbi:MAG: M15 family metallopeptidase [Rhodoplanes sp.]
MARARDGRGGRSHAARPKDARTPRPGDPFRRHVDGEPQRLFRAASAWRPHRSGDARLRNRRLLHWAMQAQGFINYIYECWHFDYGNQMYVMMRNYLDRDPAPAAWYGYVPAPAA